MGDLWFLVLAVAVFFVARSVRQRRVSDPAHSASTASPLSRDRSSTLSESTGDADLGHNTTHSHGHSSSGDSSDSGSDGGGSSDSSSSD
ncbi:hypothetical protein [Roseicella frigidaeris]|uniref:Uncharacterized protein n=1 Tax=Roseicella frigidaeris TaxID=2230885 RepID=A0A327M0T6_9PROT|nr:hypothetical protein [Roseicella frigidaeris]RAI55905.1 hypothetical protein DOO78_23435 [Roseicella frigidaeris]